MYLRRSVLYRILIACLGCALVFTAPTLAQGELAPPEITGEVVYVPFSVTIALDGDLSDWAGVPVQTVNRGTALSADPAENGAFDFRVAADTERFYIAMTMRDKTIVTGQHGRDYWNEDSLEFYLNLSGDLMRTGYGDGVFQININPGDIGLTDPAAVNATGVRAAASSVRAIVFATEDGWGFEAAVPLAPWIIPAHGVEIGFQAHANGSSGGDRNVKLIWSLADTNDQSWTNPSVFGRALFFEIGREDIPQPSARVEVALEPPPILAINQVGYLPEAVKRAALVSDIDRRLAWSLVDLETNQMVAAGLTEPAFIDPATGHQLHVADFSAVTAPGRYTLRIDSVISPPFVIAEAAYNPLASDALWYFTLNRSGIELKADFAADWARPAGHLSDSAVTCYAGTDADGRRWDGCDYTLDASRGWYDAGDLGKYVVNGGITVWTLLNLYERQPDLFPDGSLRLPERGNGIPDLLDEVRWELEFMLGMQVPEGEPLAGMAHHKLHGLQWDDLPGVPPTTVDNNNPSEARYLMPPTTAATLNLAAAAAQCARVYRTWDAAFADRCLSAAERAWDAARAHPAEFIGNTPGNGGGNYGDVNVSDEFFWAAAELYVTTGEAEYVDALRESPYWEQFGPPGEPTSFYWAETAGLGTITLTTTSNDLTAEEIDHLRALIIEAADRYLAESATQGYRVPLDETGYWWGSNSMVLNNAIVLARAYDFTGDQEYLDGVLAALHYLLGHNGLGVSFIAGYGARPMQHPHHRFWANDPALGYPPPPPGALSGGPNAEPVDPPGMAPEILARPIPLRYVDDIESYSTNEVAINWNAPLAWIAAFLLNAA